MYTNKDSDAVQSRKGDARITPIGSILRKTSLDEFPQFINVFLGNMSIVGPRPHMLKHTEEYSQIIKKYMVRHFVKPGITGLAQVKGFRGETKDQKKMHGRVKMDIFYIENWSFLLDTKIVILTILNIIRGEENAG
jgi:putative colanic acid biosynthesis UDP-glucose lipid carrier transferase